MPAVRPTADRLAAVRPAVDRPAIVVLLVAALALALLPRPWADAAVDDPPLPTVAFVARADNPVDALAAAGVAGQLGAPLYLSFPGQLHPDAEAALAATTPDVVVLAGGTGALSAAVEQAVRDLLPDATVIRKAGDTRTSTAVALSELAGELGFERPVLAGATVPGDAGVAGELTVGGVDVAASIVELQQQAAEPGPVLEPVSCFIGLGAGVEGQPVCLLPRDGSTFASVPEGMFFAVTDILAHRTNNATTGDFLGVVGVDDADDFPTFPRFEVHGTALRPFTHAFSTPLVVLTEGERIAMRNDPNSDLAVDFFVSGFLAPSVDDVVR